MRPEHGGRLELRLASAESDRVTYELSLETRDAEGFGSATIALAGGAIELSIADAALPGWLGDFARAVLRALYRAHREDGAWPRRVTRWRAEPSAR